MLGYLLARAGVQVAVFEKYADFFRDFRGDTVHPSTLTVMHELGLLDEFLKVPHNEVHQLSGRIGGANLKLVDFAHIPGPCKFVAFMPQWDFLNFLAAHGRRLPSFHLEMEALVDDLIFEGERVAGVRVTTKNGSREVRAPVIIAADGRDSILRARAQMPPRDHGSPIDVLWLRLPRGPSDPGQAFGNIAPGGVLVLLDRGDYFQCAFVIQKSGFERIKSLGLDYLRKQIVALAPFLSDRVSAIKTFDDVKLLTVTINRLPLWYRPGLLFIGDAAHAMSPIGGVGINLAIQDAVATANILAAKLRSGTVELSDLAAVQKRREFPTKVIQGFQVLAQNLGLNRVLNAQAAFPPPLLFRILNSSALFRRLPAYFIGIGPRPEHVSSAILNAG